VGVDSVELFINGAKWQNLNYRQENILYYVTWVTTLIRDGIYIIDVRVWDESGNMGSCGVVMLTVRNNVPRVLWVPDDYQTIQGAINASRDGDTVRVMAGTYREGVRLMGKKIWLESEQGPEMTMINGSGWNDGVLCRGTSEAGSPTVRGFCIKGEVTGAQVLESVAVSFYNCIFSGWRRVDDGMYGVFIGRGDSRIINCVIFDCFIGLHVRDNDGDVRNTIFLNNALAYNNVMYWQTWFKHDYNLFWYNDADYREEEPSQNDLFVNPLLVTNRFILSEDSPAINAGDPTISDLDNSRSDIGVYGGPYAYQTNR
ncbi:MAG: hypothetical protein V2A61_05615, partial [Calditrichota bacterium]